ncbi:MAG TPA: carboxypeptidase regulatory-like domain-containing protein [Terracidiphilus sp.]|nr:carboxypeptidase regulatory-like domain-containing protein [Terracidiphilus sp.]
MTCLSWFKRLVGIVTLFAFGVLVCPTLHAQFETASVLGFVHDATGAAIPGAKVTLINVATGLETTVTADQQGQYEFTSVRIGDYKIRSSADGFSETLTESFTVQVNARQRVDVTLKPGAATTTVTVTGSAALLNTEDSERGQIISQHDVSNLPLNGRAYADLAMLTPGVRANNLENQTVTSRDASYNVNGQRSEFNNFLLDGLDNNAYGTSNQSFSNQAIQPSPDAISEFRVETDNYSAEYGRASGAVFNVSINSGTNQLHGKLWEYNRNTDFNAIGPFTPPTNALTGKTVKPVLVKNQFGASIGGPMPIWRGKIFYFGDYEGNRQVQGQYSASTVPNANQRQGIFTDSNGNPVVLHNPLTGTVYSNGIVPQSDWGSLAKLVIPALPAPNIANSFSNNLVNVPKANFTDNKADARFDFFPNERTTAFFRWSIHHGNIVDAEPITGPAGGNGNGTIHDYNKQIAAGYTRTFSQTSILDARVGFTWTLGGKTPYGLGQPSLLVQAGIPGLPTSPVVSRSLNVQSVTSFSQFGSQGSNPQFQNPFAIDPKINYTKILGRHSLKVGYEYMSINTEIDDFNPVYGQDNYGGGFSAGTSNANAGSYNSNGDAGIKEAAYLTDFLIGARSAYQLNNFRIVNYHQRMNFGYVQDDFKFNRKLTVNAGLRYELVTPQWVDGNHLANYDPSTNTLIQATGGSLYGRALVNMPKLDFAPRIGFSYGWTDKTVVRGGYGLSFDQFNREGGENLLAYNGPYIVNSSITNVITNPICASGVQTPTCFSPESQGYNPNFVSSAGFSTALAQSRYIPKNIATGYVQSWHFGVQRKISENTLLDISYVGEHGVHIWVLDDINQAAPNTPSATCSSTVTTGCVPLLSRRPLTGFTGIEGSSNAGMLIYHGAQARLEHRYSGGLYLLDAFSYSRAIDNASGHLDTPNGDNSRVNLANLRGERAQSAYNQPINNTLTAIWDLPYGRGRHWGSDSGRLMQMVVGGWQVTAIETATSGQPVNLTYSEPSQFDVSDLLAYRPNVSGDPKSPRGLWVKKATSLTGYLSTATVALPTDVSHPYGNAGRNSFRDNPYYSTNLGLHKLFPLWSEDSNLDFRVEAFNAFNNVNYTAPDANRSDGGFGSITGYFPPRQLQLALKLNF